MRITVFAILILCLSIPAAAQECLIDVYGDPGGNWSQFCPPEGQLFSIYVVMFVEDSVAAAAYSLTYPTGPSGMFLQDRITGPSGNGLVIDEPTGTNAALAECVIGFGGNPVLVDEYVFVVFPGFPGGLVSVGPNTSQDPEFPQYVTCADQTKDCEAGYGTWIICEFPTEASSFGTIKSLFVD